MKRNLFFLKRLMPLLLLTMIVSLQGYSQFKNGEVASWPANQNGVKKSYNRKANPGNAAIVSNTQRNNRVLAGLTYYVNDGNTTGDQYTTAVGNDANAGSTSAPFATINHAITVAGVGDIIYVDAGIYREDIVISESLSIRGSNYGISPNTGLRHAESIIQPFTSNPDFTTGSSMIYLDAGAIGTTIDGFILDGDNTSITTGPVTDGATIDAIEAIGAYDGVANTNISNNELRNFSYGGIDYYNFTNGGAATSGNFITNNKLSNIQPGQFGIGILVYNNCYAEIKNNVMTNVRVGVQTGNYYVADPGNNHAISNNSIQASRLGIFHNLHYTNATPFVISTNTLTAVPGSLTNSGMLIGSITTGVGVSITNNNISGGRIGVNLWNCPTTNTVTVTGGTISNCKVAIFPNNFDGYTSNADPSTYGVSNVTINNCDTAFYVRDNVSNTNAANVVLNIKDGSLIAGTSLGVLIEGCDAAVNFVGATPLNITQVAAGANKAIRLSSNGTCIPTANINAENVRFENSTGATLTDAALFDLENKIDHKIDFANLGFVSVKANNNYVTVNSFYAPNTATPSIQRAIDAAVAGYIVNVGPGTYALSTSIDVNKALSIYGPNNAISAVTGTRVSEADLDFSGNANPNHVNITANGIVQIKGLKFQDNLNFSSGDRIVVYITSIFNHVVQNNIFYRAATGANGGNSHGILTGVTSAVLIDNNYFTGLNTALFNNSSWTRGIYIVSGTGAISITNNRFKDLRSHINIDFNKNIIISGNLFELENSGTTALSFGGNVAGNYTLPLNNFTGNGTFINLSSVDATFYVDATTNKYNGSVFSGLSLPNQFALEARITHGTNVGKAGFVRTRPGNVYVVPSSSFSANKGKAQLGINVALTGDTLNIADGTYLEDLTVSRSLAIIGQSRDGTILKGNYTGKATLTLNANDTKVKDVTITRDYQDWYNSTKTEGLIIENFDRMLLDNLLVKDNRNGVYVHNCKNFIIRNCTIENNRTGMQIWGPLDGGLMTNNFIRNNFTHGILFNFDQGPTSAVNLKINNNNISGNWYSQINAQRAPATPPGNVGDITGFDMTCNWLGSISPSFNATPTSETGYATQVPTQLGGTDPGVDADIKGNEAAKIPYTPYLTNGTDNDPATVGFQPVPSSCSGRTTKFYVNDGATTGDVFTTAIGNDASVGTASAPFATITKALSIALAGDSIYVDAGTYNQNVVINKSIIIRGAGMATTILTTSTACTGTGIIVSANSVVIRDMKITNFNKGIYSSYSNNVKYTNLEVSNNCAYGIELANRSDSATIVGSKVNFNTQVGIRTGTVDSVSYLTISNSEVKNNGEGLDAAASSAILNQYDYITITNSDFSNNLKKGMYLEKLRFAVIDSVIMNNSGTDVTYASNAGIDINLKYGSYNDIIIRNSAITNSGALGTSAIVEGPVALAIKARDDAPSYNTKPATLTSVTITNNILSGPQNGLRFGEPGKVNNSPTGLIIQENNLGAAFANKAIINFTANSIATTCNWFGTNDSTTIAAKITGLVTFVPYLFNGTDNNPAKPGFQPAANSCGDNQPPSVPANLQVVSISRTYVNLDWDDATDNVGVAGYNVYVNGTQLYPTTAASNITANNLLPNTSYTFTVKAVDQAGNESGVSNNAIAKTTSSGLDYKYYHGSWNTLPNFNTLTPVKTGNTPNFDISVRNAGVNNEFAFVWEGYIYIPTAGNYVFETISDDGSKLYFNSLYNPNATALVNNDGLHAPVSATGNINIPAAGLYPISVTYFEKDGGEGLQVYWSGPGIVRQLIPNSAFSNEPTATDNVAPSVPANVKVVLAGPDFLDLDWDNSTDNIGVSGYEVYINGVLKYSPAMSNVTSNGLSANTTYSITVRSKDAAGNFSSLSAPLMATTVSGANGLTYKYYEGDWNTLPDFSTLTPLKTGSTPNIDITLRNPGVIDRYAFLWQGYINIPAAGNYNFETISDDGSKFYFNSFYSPGATALVDNDGIHAPTSVSRTVSIPAAGLYPVAITFFEKVGGESMQLFWSGPGISRQLVPDAAFVGNNSPQTDNQAPTTPGNLQALYSGRTYVNLDWDNSTDNVAITAYDIYVNGTKTYTSSESAITANNLLPNTSYTFTVKARDLAGNVSTVSNSVVLTTPTTSNGVNYRYYEGTWDLLPNFNALTPVKKGLTPNIDLTVRTAGVNDRFAFVWEGLINIPSAGNYTFETVSDDGSRLYFNSFYVPGNTPLVENDGLHAPNTATGNVTVNASGLYPISIAYFEKDGGETMQIYWSGPGIPRQLIPNAAFMGSAGPVGDNVAPSIPANLQVLYTGKGYAHLDWDNSTDNVGVTGYDIFVGGVKMYSSIESAFTANNLAPGTAYNFTVKAKDFGGNLSLASNIATGTTTATANGLNYRFYQGNWDLIPNFNTLTPVSSGPATNITIATRPAGVNNQFGFVWEGYINIPTAGNYTFETISDDGSRMYFNSFYNPAATPFLDNDGLHAPVSISKTVNIPSPGLYPISVVYFEKDGGETMQLFWSGPSILRQQVPANAFTEGGAFQMNVTEANANSGLAAVTGDGRNISKIDKLYPNPFRQSFNIEYFNSHAANDINVGIYDLKGRLIYTQHAGSGLQGKTTLKVNLNAHNIPSGMYMIRLDVNGVPSKVVKLMKVN